MAVTIARRFRGPDSSGNGGYSCGLLAAGREAEVTLRLPPPLETALERDSEGRVWAGGELVAEVRPGQVSLEPPQPVGWEDALAAAAPDLGSPFPNCFVCGHARGGDGLHIHAGPVAGRGVHAAGYTVAEDSVGPEFVWAALDCPTGHACAIETPAVLARLAVRPLAPVRAGEPHVVAAWTTGRDGRKHHAAGCLYAADGTPVAVSQALWIELRDPDALDAQV